MELENVNATMLEATQESIESLAFAEVFSSDIPMNFDECNLQVQMDIHSPETGTFILQTSNRLIEEIAQALFPVEEEVTEDKLNDLASELLNTIGGNFLNKIIPENTSFKLGLPEITSPFQPDEDDEQIKWSFTLEEIPFTLYLTGKIIQSL